MFDLLVDPRGKDLTRLPLSDRRERLESFAKANFSPKLGIVLSPTTRRIAEARQWLSGRTGTDGVMAKRLDQPYRSGERTAMEKIKRKRTADCVVGGFRYATKGKVVGSLLLGLYDDDGILHHVGFTSSLSADERRRVTPVLEKLVGGKGFTGRAPGGPSRWSTKRSSEWEPLEPRLVVEVGLRSLHERSFPARNEVSSVAPRQGAVAVPLVTSRRGACRDATAAQRSMTRCARLS